MLPGRPKDLLQNWDQQGSTFHLPDNKPLVETAQADRTF
jgi:hypothetical protein